MGEENACGAASGALLTLLLLLIAGGGGAAQSSSTATSDAYLAPHNAARAEVAVAAVTWSATLAQYAQGYATAQARANACRAMAPSGGPYGENKFWGSGKAWAPSEVVGAWVATRQYFNATSNTCAAGHTCGEYTQVVWRRTQAVGCASVVCPADNSTFAMCSYSPPGNVVGQRPF